MPRLFSILALSILTAAASAAAQPADPLAGLRAAWQQALQQQDLEGSVALFTPDAIFLSPDGARYDDRAAIRTLYKSVFAAYRSRIHLTSKKQDCSGDLCVDEGTYSETMTENATGKPLQLNGSYLLVARQGPAGSWRISQMAWVGH